MAEGDLLARMGRWEEGLVAYAGASAMAPGERDVALGRARLLERAGRPDDAAAELAAWTTRHPDDGEAWDLLGRSWMRSGRPREAASAFENALQRVYRRRRAVERGARGVRAEHHPGSRLAGRFGWQSVQPVRWLD
jgi:predicted Zn-dependent protease